MGFRAIARSGDLATVLRGIELMLDANIKVKVNMVPMRTANAEQVYRCWSIALNAVLNFDSSNS
ncbi:MAG: hypothetical protein CM1200mP9_03420 [Gammaproteobacteria bacterium]|nr:MAG: hypothetical protein CM1200mP9_03420 [Gammaproteobacteria bacterium]